MGIKQGCRPREEVLKGDLDDAIFAADFGDVILGKGPKVYRDAKAFFENTHPAKQLQRVTQSVFGRLADPKEPGTTIRLSTGFGGGKTHTLLALWHLGKHVADASTGIDLLPAAGRPASVRVVAVDGSKAGNVFARHGRHEVRSLWGEIAFALGDEKAWRDLGDVDDPEKQPDEVLLERLIPPGPVLFLLDELVVYMATLSERGQGNLLAFMGKLASVASKRPQTVVVVTDPADQRSFARESAAIGTKLTSAALKLDDLFGRKVSDFDPIGDETPQVIVRRLFDRVTAAAAQKTSATYHALYLRIAKEHAGLVPTDALTPEYARRIVDCYPFHPRLIETAQNRLGALQEFNKSRGTLRLFARILRTIWEDEETDPDLITAGDLDWSSPRIQADLLQRLNRDSFKAAVSADVEKHARELDGGKQRGVHVRAASALLLESIPMQSNSGLEPAEVTLAIVRPDEAGDEPSEALERLAGVCWHTYPIPGGRGLQFRYEPNVIKQIEQRRAQIPLEDARSRLLAEVFEYFSGPLFKPVPWPSAARAVKELPDLQLVLCETEALARSVCAYSDDSDPKAPLPRKFQNAVLAITASSSPLNTAVERAQRLLACESIDKEHKSGDSAKIVREQISRIRPELLKQFRLQAYRAFDRVVLPGGVAYSIDESFQGPEEKLLAKPQGQEGLKRFLEEKGLIYRSTDALDPPRFLREVLPGTTPIPDKPGVYTTKAVLDRFLGTPKLRLVPDASIVRQTLTKTVEQAKAVVRFADGRAFDGHGCVEGPEGRRQRTQSSLPTIPLDDNVYVTTPDNTFGVQWVKEDPVKYGGSDGGPDTPPPPPKEPEGPATVTTWDAAVELSGSRPLQRLDLIARTPAAAGALAALAQPVGSDRLSLTVDVNGEFKDGGRARLLLEGMKPHHPIKPLPTAQTLFTSLRDDAEFEVTLALEFGTPGRSEMQATLERLRNDAPDGVTLRAIFGPPASKGS